MKEWYQSKLIWLMIAEMGGVWPAYFFDQITLKIAIGLTIQAAVGVLFRFVTSKPVRRRKRK